MRFMPCSAVHAAVARVPEPHQIRSASPGDCGWIGSGASKPVIAGSERTTPAPPIAVRNIAVCARATSASVCPSRGT